PALADGRLRDLHAARGGRSRITLVVALEEANVGRPCRALGVLPLRLEGDERRLALAREDRDVIALHGPVVRQVEHVVGRADDEGVEVLVGHGPADAVELRVVARPAHRLVTTFTGSSPRGGARGSTVVALLSPAGRPGVW